VILSQVGRMEPRSHKVTFQGHIQGLHVSNIEKQIHKNEEHLPIANTLVDLSIF
jgi:hypothetical protein